LKKKVSKSEDCRGGWEEKWREKNTGDQNL